MAFVSRKLTEVERKYAQIEKEALAIMWACEKFDYFLVGTEFEVETDHKPLVKLLGEKDLSDLPLRCQRFKLRLMRYRFEIFHTQGSKMFLADLLSRPAGEMTKQEEERGKRVEMHVGTIIKAEEMFDDMMMEEVRKEAEEDPIYQRVKREIESGWQQQGKKYKGEMHQYWTQKEQLTEQAGIVMRNERMVIPKGMRREMIERIHRGHQGVEKCLKRARESVWWPKIREELGQYIEKCNECIKNARMKHQPLTNSQLPEGPWEAIGTDLFEFEGRDYLLAVDYFTRWIEVVEIRNKTAESVVQKMKGMLAKYGVPKVIRSDNGPCYRGKFEEFAREWKIRHVTSSPLYPESNGLAERAVGTIKRMWRKEKDKNMALMVYRNTPLDSGKSPAELLFNRTLRTNLPKGESKGTEEDFRQKDKQLKERQKKQSDRRRRAKQLEKLKAGDEVWVKTNDKEKGEKGIVERPREEKDSYEVRVKGRVVRRNRKDLRKRFNKGAKNRREEKANSEEEEKGSESEEETEEEEEETDENEEVEENLEEGEEEEGNEAERSEDETRPRMTLRSANKRPVSTKHMSTDYDWRQ